MIFVSDTSPLTNLAAVGHLHLLEQLYRHILIPEAVARELSFADPQESGHVRVSEIAWISVRAVWNQDSVTSLRRELGWGEAEAVILAQESAADFLIIDERRGSRIALERGVSVMGILGVLLQAKREALISHVRPILDDLIRNAGFWISAHVYSWYLVQANESSFS